VISLDGFSVYLPVARERIPHATVCLDPFHVVKWTNEVLDSVYRAEAPRIRLARGLPTGRDWRRTAGLSAVTLAEDVGAGWRH
jgi:transposase